MVFRLLFFLIISLFPLVLAAQKVQTSEKKLIRSGAHEQKMVVLQTINPDELVVLQKLSNSIPRGRKVLWKRLSHRMMASVTNPEHLGVGLAAPQVGVNRRLIIVQRFDQPDRPFQVIVNPEITAVSDSVWEMPEGCLSIPGIRDTVCRPWQISLKYRCLNGKEYSETVTGFTARIFQHEIDHLNGILITDHIEKKRKNK